MGKGNACELEASHANTAAATPSKRVPLRVGCVGSEKTQHTATAMAADHVHVAQQLADI